VSGGYDLHTHTVCSDGTTTPERNVADAVALGLEGLAVTDHDTLAGVTAACEAARGTGLEVIGGTELSAEADGYSVHVLGYWVSAHDVPLTEEMARLRDERTDRARRMVGRLAELGVDISFERVAEIVGSAPVGRPHVAQAVVEAGGAASLREVFDRYLADGGPAYVPKHAVTPAEAVRLIVGAGGVAVLAHPGLYGSSDDGLDDEEVTALAAAGLAGIEADHPDHTAAQRTRYRTLAGELGLEVTAGSDYHGEKKSNRLGCAVTPREVVDRLRARHRT
jgi:3',5'-nucleoside bisphosphate phosphatase